MKTIPDFRWIYPIMALVFIILILIGFFPDVNYRVIALFAWVVVAIEYLSYNLGKER